MPNFSFFKLDSRQLRILDLSELSGITITAQCTSYNTGFEFEISNSTPETWFPLPATIPSGIFSGVTDQCSTLGKVAFTLNLSSYFGGMTLGTSREVKIREQNSLAISTVDTFTIRYSVYDIESPKRLLGQGGPRPLQNGVYSLSGQVTEISDSFLATSGPYSLQGKAVFQ